MRNILIVTYWSYKDALIQTYTLPYVTMIRENLTSKQKIYLVTMEQSSFAMSKEDWEKEKSLLKDKNIHLLRYRYSPLGIVMLIRNIGIFCSLFFILFRRKISHIHAWCTPSGAIGYLLSILSGKKLIIDSYEPHAEAMVENGSWSRKGMAFKLLFWLEKKQSGRASAVIALTSCMRDYAQKKYHVKLNNMFVKPAFVDFALFQKNYDRDKLRKELGIGNEVVCVYAGKFGGIYLDKEIFDFFKVCLNHRNGDFKALILTNTDFSVVMQLAKEAHYPTDKLVYKCVDHNSVPKYLSVADFALNPVKPVPSKRYCTSIKDGEYWAMGLPVVITKNISDDSDIIQKNDIGYVLNDLTLFEYKKASVKIIQLLNKDMETLIVDVAKKYRNSKLCEIVYAKIYGRNS